MARLLSKAQAIAPGLLVGLAACMPADGAGADQRPAAQPVYGGVETRMIDAELVSLRVSVQGTGDENDVAAYATCAAAQYALIRGYGFARHVRTNVTQEEGGIWRADAVYTISPALPRGLRTIDAEVTVEDCADRGIPTV